MAGNTPDNCKEGKMRSISWCFFSCSMLVVLLYADGPREKEFPHWDGIRYSPLI